MQRGEIWLVSLDPTAGHEQQSVTPVVWIASASVASTWEPPKLATSSRAPGSGGADRLNGP